MGHKILKKNWSLDFCIVKTLLEFPPPEINKVLLSIVILELKIFIFIKKLLKMQNIQKLRFSFKCITESMFYFKSHIVKFC